MSTPDEFARTAADVLRARGELRPISLDVERDRLVVGEGDGPISFVHLFRARAEWLAAPMGSKSRVLHRRFWSAVKYDSPPNQEQLLQGVTLRVRDRAWFAAMRRQAELELGADEAAIDGVALPHQVINDEFAVHLAFDLPSSITEIGSDRLAKWGLTFEQLFEHGKKNLREISQAPWEPSTPGFFISPFHDTLDATRIALLPEMVTSLALKGTPIFVAPTHDIAFVTGEDDVEGLMQLAEWTEEALGEPRGHSTMAFRLENGGWKRWLPPTTHAAYSKFVLLALQTTAAAYARQKDILDALLAASGQQILVATLRAFRGPTGALFTGTVWQEGLEMLLPQTDRIEFVRAGNSVTSPARVWNTSFEVARKTLGDLMQPIGEQPERYLVRRFPSDAQLEAMALEGKL